MKVLDIILLVGGCISMVSAIYFSMFTEDVLSEIKHIVTALLLLSCYRIDK